MKITSIQPAYYFSAAVVIRTECGHSHLRPKSMVTAVVGDDWKCYCEEAGKGGADVHLDEK